MEHPITARQSLVEKWLEEAMDQGLTAYALAEYIVTQAVRWGADQELKACCEWLDDDDDQVTLRAARRPKSLGLKERALKALDSASYQPGSDFK